MRALFAVVVVLCAACSGSAPVSDGGQGGGGGGGGTSSGGGSAVGGGSPTGGGTGGGDAGMPDAGPADSGTPDAGLHLALALHRLDAGILAVVSATTDLGAPITGLNIVVETSTSSGQAFPMNGAYESIVLPAITSGELPITARLSTADAGVTQTAVLVRNLGPIWDQPIALGGLVNTPGTEDSSTVSPDGEWLIVGTYSPVDLVCCFAGCAGWDSLDGRSPYCNLPLGPASGAARPNLPGAERIIGNQVVNAVPQLCVGQPDGGPVLVPANDGGTRPFALPPVAAYQFHRQSDGTFAEPHVVDVGADGFLGAPACFTFLGTADAGQQVLTLLGYSQYPVDTKPHPWFGQVTLGHDTLLGHYFCDAGTAQFNPIAMEPVPVGPKGQQAINTTATEMNGNIFLLSDDESATPPYSEWSLVLPDGGFTDWQPMGLPDPTADRRQPIAIGDHLFYSRNGDIVGVGWDGGSLSSSASFTAAQVQLGLGTLTGSPGEIIALGQPTFAQHANAGHDGGVVEMYFVYYRRTATGLDGQIGRVPFRN